MASLSDFLSRVMPNVTGCPEPFATQAVRDSAAEFCRETSLVVDTITVNVQALTRSYFLTASTDKQVYRVLRAALDDVPLLPVGLDWLSFDEILSKPTGYAVKFAHPGPTLFLTTTPTDVGVLTVEAATAPTLSAATLDDRLLHVWGDAVVSGAISRLAMTPGVGFSSPELASVHRQIFLTEVRRAKTDNLHGANRVSLSVAMRPFV